MTRTYVPRMVAASAALALAIGLAACTSDTDAPDATSPAGTPTETGPEPTTEPTATDQPAIGTSCEDVLTPEAYAQLEADGLTARDLDPKDPVIDRIAEGGGLVCSWGKPQSGTVLHVAQLSGVDEATWAQVLAETGYTQSDDPVPGAWTGPLALGADLRPVVVLADGTVTFVSAPTFAQWVRPAS
jgi:hypothetical protein